MTPSKDEARDAFALRILPHLQACEPVARKLPTDDRTDIKSRQIMFGPGMGFYVASAATKAELESKPARVVIMDEARQYRTDAIPRAKKRFRSYKDNHKCVIITTPDQAGDNIDSEHASGTMRQWMIPCDKCGTKFPFFWAGDPGYEHGGLQWDQTEGEELDGKPVMSKIIPTIRFECPNPACNRVWRDNPVDRRYIATANGTDPDIAWEQTNPEPTPGHESFSWEAGMVPWTNWWELVEEFINAKALLRDTGDPEPLKVFFRETRGISWDDRLMHLSEAKALDTRRVRYNVRAPQEYVIRPARPKVDPDPMAKLDKFDEVARFMSIDVQGRPSLYYYYIVRAWARNGVSRLLSYGTLHSRAEIDQTARDWGVHPKRVLIDSGYATKDVYQMVMQSGNLWRAMKGEDKAEFRVNENGKPVRKLWQISSADPELGTAAAGRVTIPLVIFAKYGALERLDTFLHGRYGDWQVPDDVSDSYMKQVTAYHRNPNRRSREQWKKPNDKYADHYASCEIQCITAANMMDLVEMARPIVRDAQDTGVVFLPS